MATEAKKNSGNGHAEIDDATLDRIEARKLDREREVIAKREGLNWPGRVYLRAVGGTLPRQRPKLATEHSIESNPTPSGMIHAGTILEVGPLDRTPSLVDGTGQIVFFEEITAADYAAGAELVSDRDAARFVAARRPLVNAEGVRAQVEKESTRRHNLVADLEAKLAAARAAAIDGDSMVETAKGLVARETRNFENYVAGTSKDLSALEAAAELLVRVGASPVPVADGKTIELGENVHRPTPGPRAGVAVAVRA